MLPVYEGCHLCEKPGEFECIRCGESICGNDVRIRVVCTQCLKLKTCNYSIHQASCDDVGTIAELVQLFWGDPEQHMFDTVYRVVEQPAIVAEADSKIVGFIAFTDYDEKSVLIVALGILPNYHGCGIGKQLVENVEAYAISQKKHQLLVVTSNDNLPALAFYQQQGFQLYEVAPNVIAQKLGGVQLGIANIPIRDELRLRKILP